MIQCSASPGYSSGQRGQTVNLLASVYVGSNPTPGTNGHDTVSKRLPSLGYKPPQYKTVQDIKS